MKKQDYFSTGEFAKLANISKQTLIYYDKVDIFSPVYKDEKKFRYYSLGQFEALDTLINLREIGVPLKEIKDYLSHKNMESLAELLKNKNEGLQKQIKKLKHISKKIENKSLRLEKAQKQQLVNEPYFEKCETSYILSSNVESDDYRKIMGKIIEFINYYKNLEQFDNGNPIGGIIKKEDLLSGRFNNIKAVYIMIDCNNTIDETAKLEGIYAHIIHKGNYDTTHISYKKLIDYINKNGYEIIGDAYENELIGYLSVQSQEEYLIEISVQVKKL